MVTISKTWMIILIIGSIVGYGTLAGIGAMMVWYAIDELTRPRD